MKAVQQQMETQLKMREQQTAAEIREEQRKVKELFQILRQHFAEANKLYLKDVENYKAAMKVEVENVKNAFDKTYYTTLWTGGNGGYEGLLGTPRTLGVTGRYDF